MVTTLLAVVLVWFPYDLRAQAMMGDCGANTSGFALGFMALGLPVRGHLILLVFLIAVHGLAEKYSFSAIIERYCILHRIDQ